MLSIIIFTLSTFFFSSINSNNSTITRETFVSYVVLFDYVNYIGIVLYKHLAVNNSQHAVLQTRKMFQAYVTNNPMSWRFYKLQLKKKKIIGNFILFFICPNK